MTPDAVMLHAQVSRWFVYGRALALSMIVTLPLSGWQASSIIFDLPCNSARSTELAERARAANRSGDAQMAAVLFRQGYEACPLERQLLLDAAQAFTAALKFDGAIESANEFLRREPRSLDGRLVLANALLMAQKWEACGQEVERALKLDPKNRRTLLLKGNFQYLTGELRQAEQTLLEALDLYPEDEDAAYTLGRIYYMDSRADHAAAMFQRVVKVNPKSYKAWDNLALCYEALGDSDKAIQHFLTAIKLVEKDHPSYDWPYANLADLLLRQGRDEEAYRAATTAAKRNPYSARNFYLGGKALSKLDRPEDAIKWLERSAELDPNYSEPLYVLGQLQIKAGNKQKGAETLEKFRQLKAKEPSARR